MSAQTFKLRKVVDGPSCHPFSWFFTSLLALDQVGHKKLGPLKTVMVLNYLALLILLGLVASLSY